MESTNKELRDAFAGNHDDPEYCARIGQEMMKKARSVRLQPPPPSLSLLLLRRHHHCASCPRRRRRHGAAEYVRSDTPRAFDRLTGYRQGAAMTTMTSVLQAGWVEPRVCYGGGFAVDRQARLGSLV